MINLKILLMVLYTCIFFSMPNLLQGQSVDDVLNAYGGSNQLTSEQANKVALLQNSDQINKSEPNKLSSNLNQNNLNEKKSNKPSSIEKKFVTLEDEATYSPTNFAQIETVDNSQIHSKQFGYDFFNQTFSEEDSFLNVPVGNDYILGPGDELVLYLWGKIEKKITAQINQSGTLYLPIIGEISLAGLSLEEGIKIIRNEINNQYINVDVSVSLSRLRSIQVYVVGEVNSPGAYNVSSLSSLIGALYISGGVKKTGSLRSIKLIRKGGGEKLIDLYDYLINGNEIDGTLLKAEDTIFVPVIGDVFNVSGEVKRPAIYEKKDEETFYDAVIRYAGGFNYASYRSRIQIQRVINGEKYVIKDIQSRGDDLLTILSGISVENGDIVTAFPILNDVFNKIEIWGSVERPGKYEYFPEMTLKQLVDNAEGVSDLTYFDRADIFRKTLNMEKEIITLDLRNIDAWKIKLKEFDVVKIYSKIDITHPKRITVVGAVRNKKPIEKLDAMTLEDAIFLSKPLKNANITKIHLARTSDLGKVEIKILDLSKNEELKNMLLNDEDIIYIYKDEAKYQRKSIAITGEVKYPGSYEITDGETVSDVINRAGGLVKDAFFKGLLLERKANSKVVASALNKLIESENKRIVFDQSQNNESDNLDHGIYKESLIFLQNKSTNSLHRIVLKLTEYKMFEGSKYDIKLENHDSIHIPKQPSAIQIVGGVMNPASFLVNEKKSAKHYIQLAGGFSDFANKKKVVIFRVNGSVSSNLKHIEAGDTIYVPEKIKYPNKILDSIVKVTRVLANIATTIILLNNI